MTIQANFPAIKPSLMLDFANTKQLDSRITYTRASTATFYNGVTTAMAEQNLLTYSQEFSNAAWTKYKASITANTTTAPDGTATASTLTENNENFQHLVYRNNATNFIATGNIGTLSIYAKANTRSWVHLNLYDGSNRLTWFDLTNGVVGTNASGNTATITSVGSGWYRCIISRTIANGGVFSPEYGISSGDNVYSYLGDGTSNIYIWGAQLEQRSAVSTYTTTTTQAITNYIPVLQTAASGVARFDNNPTTGESLGLLIEESRTNLMTYSSQLDNGVWAYVASSITADTVVAPDGTLTGDKLVENTASSTHSVYARPNITSGTTYALSFYVKPSGRNRVTIQQFNSASPYAGATFDVSTGTVVIASGTGASGSIISVGNGWYRCVLIGVANETTSSYMQISLAQDSHASTGAETYTGNGFSGAFVWGAQLEAGAFATSYIPTVASQVTRAADAASMTGTNFSSWFNAGQGTIYSDSLPLTAVSSARVLSISDNTATNRMMVIASSIDHFFVTSNGTNVAAIDAGAYSTTTTNRQGSAYAVSDYAASINSGTVGTSTSGALPSGLNRLYIGANHDGTALFLNGTIKKIAYYPFKATSAQLQALTS